MFEAAAIVLAGGESKRMGNDKTALPLGNRAMLQVVVDKLKPLFNHVYVVKATDTGEVVPGATVVADIVPKQGPLGGLYSGLRQSEARLNFVTAADMPFLSPRLVRGLLSLALANPAYDVIVPRVNGSYQPLHALYTKNIIPLIEPCLRPGADRSLHALIKTVRTIVVPEEILSAFDPNLMSFVDINTPNEYCFARRVIEA